MAGTLLQVLSGSSSKNRRESRHDAQAKAEAAQTELCTLKSEKAASTIKLEARDTVQRGGTEAGRESIQSAKAMERELEQLKRLKLQFLALSASLKGTRNADSHVVVYSKKGKLTDAWQTEYNKRSDGGVCLFILTNVRVFQKRWIPKMLPRLHSSGPYPQNCTS
jgi:hypothetical protein